MNQPAATPTIATVVIFAHHLEAARAKLEKAAKRAARYGQTIEWTERRFTETVKRTRWDGKPVEVEVARCELTITGDAPRVGEFKFLASLERAPGGVIISAIRGQEIGDLGRDWDGRCEHCGQNRARKQAFVVEGPEGRKVVGKSCLRDHLGTDAPAGLVHQFTFEDLTAMGADEEEGGWGGYGRWQESTLGVIATTRAAIALWGWRPSSHEGMTTALYVNLIYGPVTRDHKGREHNAEERAALRTELRERGDHYYTVAQQVIDWGAAMTPRGDYEHNLKVALAGDIVISKTFNLVVSAAAAYDRQVAREDEAKRQREAEEARKAALPKSHHVGEPGQRVTADVTLERRIALPDYGYGPSSIYVFRADDGAIMSWKTTAGAPRIDGKPLEQGDRAAMTATVKAHADFKGEAETRVQRAAFAKVDAKVAA